MLFRTSIGAEFMVRIQLVKLTYTISLARVLVSDMEDGNARTQACELSQR